MNNPVFVIADYIDHTLLKPEATPQQIKKLCEEAVIHNFASVCVNPTYVTLAAKLLQSSEVAVCTVIGFPLGANTTAVKIFEAMEAMKEGADELDMVINIGHLKSGGEKYVEVEIKMLADVVHAQKKILKVIIETVLLTDEEKRLACMLAKLARADFVKTSTGFSGGGATVADIMLMRSVVGPDMGIKASGGIADYAQAKALIDAGATRLGTSKGMAIVLGTPVPEGGY